MRLPAGLGLQDSVRERRPNGFKMARRTIYLDSYDDNTTGSAAGEPSAIFTFLQSVVREARTWVSRGGPAVKTPTIEKQTF
ncbi:hypothetical protein TARUN_6846 [Trichoderma arundinaceum]|uniref:Uncharacterized protein n=1 Tax=Trichoderma arundinaceum TaxID=490622 RepID=A0A395NHS5_TRIAR|nr:hypothetical protein TARUN_6846 [Trichoderma arundinaceum]